MTSRRRLAAIAAFAAVAAGLLSACGSLPQAGADTWVRPPAALTMRDVPPVAAALAARIGTYNEFRGAGLLDWHPDGDTLLVTFRRGNTTQLHRAALGQPLQPLTHAAEPTRSGRYLPADGNTLVFARDAGGSEATQLYRLDLASGGETRLTSPEQRHSLGTFNRAGTHVAMMSVPLDRTASGGTRATIDTELSLLDPRTGQQRQIAMLPGPGWSAQDFSADDATLLLSRFKSDTDAEVWRIDFTSGKRIRLLPREGEAPAFYVGPRFSSDGRRLFVATDRFGEFLQLFRFDPGEGQFEPVTGDVPWDVDFGSDLANDRKRLAVIHNEAGRGVLRIYDAETLRPIRTPAIAGTVREVQLSPDGRRVALAVSGADSPGTVKVLDIETGRLESRVLPDTAGVDIRTLRPTEIIDWPSFDGRRINGLITRPPERFAGKRPVLIEIHGGPTAQATLGFKGRLNYLINELGVVLIEPNVRGSSGFGNSFISLDNGRQREDAVRDIGALLDWITAQPDLDASRVLVQGGSYGGYMTLAVAVHYGERIRGAIGSVGISHFVSFLQRTESYRRDLRRVEYGDERDPQMRAFLDRISPLTNAAKIRTPLFILHGRNDPRVPVQEAEQIVATVRSNGVPVWSLIAENEGHGFAKKENADYAFYARVKFIEQVLLGGN